MDSAVVYKDNPTFTKSRTINSFGSSPGQQHIVLEPRRSERAPPHRPTRLPPLATKTTPSKWDDAQKWIANPMGTGYHPKAGGDGSSGNGYKRKDGSNKQSATVVVRDVFADDLGPKWSLDWEDGRFEKKNNNNSTSAVSFAGSSVTNSSVNLIQHDSSTTLRCTTSFTSPPITAKSISMRDMGTEMTPIASQEPSRNGTPVRDDKSIPKPTLSWQGAPDKVVLASPMIAKSSDLFEKDVKEETSQSELQIKTRREIMTLGTKLGKVNVVAWASKKQEPTKKYAASMPLKKGTVESLTKNGNGARASAWEEAEKAKYLARFKREEVKIEVWESHLKAKAEAQLKKFENKVEKMRARAHDRLMSKLEAAKHKAEKKLAAAEAQRDKQAEKKARQAEHLKRIDGVPSSYHCCHWCSS